MNIKDVEEKRLILAYYLSKNKKDNHCFSDVKVWHQWTGLWNEDFRTESGKFLKRYGNQFVLSKTKAKKQKKEGTLIQEFKEYDDFLNEICQWVNENYKRNKGRMKNANIMKERLLAYKRECALSLLKYFDNNGFAEKGFRFQNLTSRKESISMGKYCILAPIEEGRYKGICCGSYETVMKFLKNEMEECKQK